MLCTIHLAKEKSSKVVFRAELVSMVDGFDIAFVVRDYVLRILRSDDVKLFI